MSSSTKRAAAVGLAGALAFGTVASVGAITPAASAEATTFYTCTLDSTGPVDLPVTGSVTLPATMQSGQSLAGLAAGLNVLLPAPLVGAIYTAVPGTLSIGGSTDPLSFPFGSGVLQTGPMTLPQTAKAPDGTMNLQSTGKTVAGAAGAPGVYEATMPSDFVFKPVLVNEILGPVPLGAVPCTAKGEPASLGTVTVTKATSTVVTKVTNAPITTAKRAKILVKVRSTATNTGKVLIKKGTTVLAKGTLSGGKKTLVLPKLKRGTHRLVAIYKGDASTKAGKKAFDLTVRRG